MYVFSAVSARVATVFLVPAVFLVASVLTPAALGAQDVSDPTAEGAGPTPAAELNPQDAPAATLPGYDQGITINKVSIEGNKLVEAAHIKQVMMVHPGSLYSKRTLQQDLKRIYDMGYFTEKIRAVPISTREGIHLRIEVEENAPVTGVNIQGNTLLKSDELQSVFASQTGLPQNIGQLNEGIEKIEKLYADKGYILARVKNISDDPDGVINVEVNEGIIDNVAFVGNRKTKDFVMRRSMTTKEGQVYNEKALLEDLKRIYATQAFSDVRRVITASSDNPDHYQVTVEVDEKKTGAISLGGGFDTGTGLFGSLGYTDPNFLGRGQMFNSGFSVGSGVIGRDVSQANARLYQFEVGWTEPSLFGTENALSVNAYGRDLASFNVPLGVERRVGLESTWSRPILSHPSFAFSLTARGENVRLREAASRADLRRFNLGGQERRDMLEGGTFLSFTPTLAYDTRDNRFNPTTGWFNTVSLTPALGLGASSYGTANVNLRRYFKLREGMVLALNAQGGTKVLGDIPAFNTFRMGGIYSVRGWQEGGLGTGQGFAMASAEIRSRLPFANKLKHIPIANSISSVFFADAGTLFRESVANNLFDRAGLGASIGLGLRFNMPGIGPIRIDYALPISGGNSEYFRRFNFGVGQKF
jgi:outer membrane protein insertion porin family